MLISGKFNLFELMGYAFSHFHLYYFYYTVLYKTIALTCKIYTLHRPVEGSPAGRKEFAFTSLPDDNGGKKLFLLISAEHLAKRAFILIHCWKTALECA